MQAIANRYLNIIELIQLESWSVQSLLESKVQYSNRFELAKIGDFLIKNRTIVNIEDDKIYRRVTVKINNNGVFLRDTEKGINIGTKKQYLAKAGQFIVSKIDARNGAFGIIPNDLHGAIVTNDFPLFDVNQKRINTQFLLLITTTKQFIKFAQSCSSGTTNRQRMDIDLFLNQKIPLPSIGQQNEIINTYNKKINQASNLRQEANTLEEKIGKYFIKELGIERQKSKAKKVGLYFIKYEKLERWDGKTENEFVSKFPISKMGKYIIDISTGTTPPTGKQEYFNGDVNFYTPSDLGNEMYLTTAERKITDLAIKDKKARRFEKGTLLFVGIGSTVGKIGIVGNEFATSNQQITGFKVDHSVLNNEFVYLYFNLFKDITTKEQTKATLPIVNQDKIINIPIPIPPIETQNAITKNIISMTQKATKLKNQAVQMLDNAGLEFEQAIFKNEK